MSGARRKVSTVTEWKQTQRAELARKPLKDKASRRITIVAAGFNGPITQALLAAAEKTLMDYGIPSNQVTVVWTPGSFEVPCAVSRALKSKPKPDAVITVGSLIKGETVQYEVIAHSVAQSLQALSIESGVPISFGIVVASSIEQAQARSGGDAGNRGEEAAQAALQLLEQLEGCGI